MMKTIDVKRVTEIALLQGTLPLSEYRTLASDGITTA
jgi:hypothetical protein